MTFREGIGYASWPSDANIIIIIIISALTLLLSGPVCGQRNASVSAHRVTLSAGTEPIIATPALLNRFIKRYSLSVCGCECVLICMMQRGWKGWCNAVIHIGCCVGSSRYVIRKKLLEREGASDREPDKWEKRKHPFYCAIDSRRK